MVNPLSLSIVVLCVTLLACHPESDANSAASAKILNISERPFTFNDEPGVFINFATGSFSECSLTLAQSSIKAGISLETHITEGPLDLSCLSDGEYYMLNEKKTTYAKMHVETMDDSGALIIVSGVMYSVGNQQIIQLDDVKLQLSATQAAMLKK